MKPALSDLEPELTRLVPGFELIDRQLVVRDDLELDGVGFDADGALVVVLWTDGASAGVPLDVLDALAFVRSHIEVLARHWHLDPLALPRNAAGGGLELRAVCLAETFAPEVVERLLASNAAPLELVELRTVSSALGTASYLVPVRAAGAAPLVPAPVSFLDGVPDELRPLSELFLARMERIDPRVEVAESADGVEWFVRSRAGAGRPHVDPVGALSLDGERLEASLPGFDAPLSVRGEGDVDEFVDQALARLVDLSPGPPRTARAAGSASGGRARAAGQRGSVDMPRDIHPEAQDEPGAGGRGAQAHGARDHFASRDESAEFDELEDPGDPGDPEDPGDSEDLGDLEDIELIPMDSGALLTPEEIEAFRD